MTHLTLGDDYVQELRDEGYNIFMGDQSYQYSEEDLHVVDRLVAWITQMMFAENLISQEAAEMGAWRSGGAGNCISSCFPRIWPYAGESIGNCR